MEKKEKRCNNCRFHSKYYECRKHAPIVVMQNDRQKTISPITSTCGWCGDWEEK